MFSQWEFIQSHVVKNNHIIVVVCRERQSSRYFTDLHQVVQATVATTATARQRCVNN